MFAGAAPLSRTQLVAAVKAELGVEQDKAEAIVTAFDIYVAKPLAENLKKLRGRDLAKRNPMIYTSRGVTSVADWVRRVLDDKETSAIESHIGTWQEEVARIVSGGFKPGSGVDLQREPHGSHGVVELYAIQSAPNTKSAGGRRSDVVALQRAAAALRSSRRPVEMSIAVLTGRRKSAPTGEDPNVVVLASDEFWERVSGIADFRARLLRTTTILSDLVQGRAASEALRITDEAGSLFDDGSGNLDYARLANPPSPPPRSSRSNGS